MCRWLKAGEQAESGVGPGSVRLHEANRRIRVLGPENKILRRAAAFVAQDTFPKVMYPLVIGLTADGIPVRRLRRVFGFSPKAFRRWLSQPYSDRDSGDARLVSQIIDIRTVDLEFGYRFIAEGLHKAGVDVSQSHVQRLCHEHKIFSVLSSVAKKRPEPKPASADDLVKGHPVGGFDFTAKCFVACRYHRASNRRRDAVSVRCHTCAVQGHRPQNVGYSINGRMIADLAVGALRNAIATGDIDSGLVVYPNRGGQFQFPKIHEYRHLGQAAGVNESSRNISRQHGHGIVLLATPKERSKPPTKMGHQRPTTNRDHEATRAPGSEETYPRRGGQQRLGKFTQRNPQGCLESRNHLPPHSKRYLTKRKSNVN